MGGRQLTVAVVTASVITGVASAVVAAVYQPDPGVGLNRSQSHVTHVLPGGPAWTDGIRVGQRVLEVGAADAPSEWQVITTDGGDHYATTAGGHAFALRSALPVSLLATASALIAAVAVRRVAAVGTAFASAAVVLASQPISLTGQPIVSTAVTLVAAVAGAIWLWSWGLGPTGVRHAAAATASIAVGVWLYARFAQPDFYGPADMLRVVVMATTSLGVLMYAVPWRAWLRGHPLAAGRGVDIAVAAAAAGLAIVCSMVLSVPILISLVVLVVVLSGYPAVRHAVLQGMNRLVFAEVRERASLAAVEDERTRLAADIHDVPLQELAGIIHRLEARDAAEEAEMLRSVAAHLRAVTTELRPPVLDDLGLGPALAFLVQEASSTGGAMVEDTIVDSTGIELGERVPRDVEVAVFRIVQEALANACQHADAATVRLEGELTRERVAITVTDDGVGITSDAKRSARERGHLGLTSMAARASGVDASLSVDAGTPSGTRISLLWRSA